MTQQDEPRLDPDADKRSALNLFFEEKELENDNLRHFSRSFEGFKEWYESWQNYALAKARGWWVKPFDTTEIPPPEKRRGRYRY